jgi:hypothetical protein
VDKENEAYAHNGVLFTIKKNEIMIFVGKLMALEIIMISKISQTEKAKYLMFSHMWNLALKMNDRNVR